MTSERVTELRDRADLIMAWEAFEPGMEAPAPLDYEDTACKLMEAAAYIERLRAALKPFADALTEAEETAYAGYSPDELLAACRARVTLYEFAMARQAPA